MSAALLLTILGNIALAVAGVWCLVRAVVWLTEWWEGRDADGVTAHARKARRKRREEQG